MSYLKKLIKPSPALNFGSPQRPSTIKESKTIIFFEESLFYSYACNILPFAENISKQDFPEKPVKLYSVINITIIKKTYDLKVRYRNNNALFLLRLTEDKQIILEAKT